MFTHAIVKTPGISLAKGISSANLGRPVYEKALEQHAAYVETLKQCSVDVVILEVDAKVFKKICILQTMKGSQSDRSRTKHQSVKGFRKPVCWDVLFRDIALSCILFTYQKKN